MLKGAHLTLMMGPVIPTPVPAEVAEAFSSLEVTNSKERSGFQITFTVGTNSSLLTSLLPSGFFDPITTRVIIIITLNGTPNVLADGLVTKQNLSPSSEPGQSKLVITGEDLSVAMDFLNRTVPYPALNTTAKVLAILAPYAALGVMPLVIPPFLDPPSSPTEKHETQTTTDRAYLKKLAKEAGYVFFVQAGPVPYQSIAYFGPDANLPVSQPAISINMDANTSIESLNFTLDGLAKKLRVYTIMDPITKRIPLPVPIPDINAFKPPLGSKPAFPAGLEFDGSSARLGPVEAAKKVIAHLMNNSSSISGSGSLDVMKYKHILKARMLVGVRGAGLAYDGLYYVDSVTHNIKPGEYKQSFTLSRDGLISKTSSVAI